MVTGSVSEERWAHWRGLRLSSDAIELLLLPEVGARVVSLRDRRSGREWLTDGRSPTPEEAAEWSGEGAVFGGRVSFGWDECLPTVSPCPDPLDLAAVSLRDHGDQWGRPTVTSIAADGEALETEWTGARWGYRFSRRLTLVDGATVLCEYSFANTSEGALPLLWSMHPCLRLEPGCRLDLPAVASARATWAPGLGLEPGDVAWPAAGLSDGTNIDLSLVRSGEGWAAKLYAVAARPVRAVAPDGASLEIDWDREVAQALGIWLSYGGWPVGGPPVEQVALEPTMSPDDHLHSALEGGRARSVAPGERLGWWVRLRLAT